MPNDPEAPKIAPSPEVPEAGAEAPEQGAGFEAAPAPVHAPGSREPGAPPAPAPSPSAPPAPAPGHAPKDPTTEAVEDILEEDLAETYASLPPDAKKKFREEGAKATEEISGMVRSLKVQARKVIGILRDWLRIIPGVNRFFLEQEAKIKTDKIMRLAEEEKKRRETGL